MSKAELDHLLFGVPDLSEGVAFIQAKLGTAPVPGGKHPGVGTHNALLALGPGTYLEIIAPDPAQNVPKRNLPYGLAELTRPRLVTWAVRPMDWRLHLRQTERLGLETRLHAGFRASPDGVQFRWRSAQPVPPVAVDGHDLTGLIPFAIEWQSDQHPAASAPGNFHLEALVLMHPHPHVLSKVVDELALPCTVDFAPEARMAARIHVEPDQTVLLA